MMIGPMILALSAQQADYATELTKWREELQRDLEAPSSWLAVVDLVWLADGSRTPFGFTADGHPIIPTTGPASGVFVRVGNKVSVEITDPKVTVDGNPQNLRSDQDKVVFGGVTMSAIQRGQRFGIRVWDANSEARRNFKGQQWFPADQKFVVEAKYVAYDKPRQMMITNVIGDTEPVPNPGYVEFTFDGKKCHLEAQAQGPGFFFNFKDLTSGKKTYPAGRFLNTGGPVNGIVTLDFNRAMNPPCAFTSHATCPLPPKENNLPVAINAGELVHHPDEEN